MLNVAIEQITNSVRDLLQATTIGQKKKIIEKHSELLSNQVDQILNEAIATARIKNKQGAERDLIKHRKILQICRKHGIATAFGQIFQKNERYASKAQTTYLQTGNLHSLDEAIAAWERILNHVAFLGVIEEIQLAFLNNASIVFDYRYRARGQLSDLARVVKIRQEIVDLISADSPQLPIYLHNLSSSLAERYGQQGDLADLTQAIDCIQRAVTLIFQDFPHKAALLHNLALRLSERYERLGQLDDSVKAIETSQQAVNLTPVSSPDRPMYLNSLSNQLSTRYARQGQLHDLIQAIETSQQAIDLTPTHSLDRPRYLSSLGNRLRSYYVRTNELNFLLRAIEVSQQAVDLTPPEAIERSVYINNLSILLHDLYRHTGNLEWINRAVELHQDTLNIVSLTSPNRPGLLSNLGNRLHARYLQRGELSDLKQAITATQEAVKLVADHSPYLSMYLNNLGNRLSELYKFTGGITELEQAKDSYRQACKKSLSPEDALRASQNWGNWALTTRRSWSEVTEAYTYGIQAIDDLFQTQLQRHHKEIWLRDAQGLHANAAYAHTKIGKLEPAITTIEQGRAFLLSESLEQTRANLERLPDLDHADLYGYYQTMLNRLWVLEHQENAEINALREARAELDKVIGQIQQLPSYEDFFRPPTFEGDVLGAIQPF